MGKRKDKRRKGALKSQNQVASQPSSASPPIPSEPLRALAPVAASRPEQKFALLKWIAKRIPGWVWLVVVAGSVLLAYLAAWPHLSVNTDFSYDSNNVYDTSFVATNEGFWPAQDLSVICKAHVILHSPPSPDLPLDTADANHAHFEAELHWHHRASLPCNHNVIAYGHYLAPDSTLAITVKYRVAGLRIPRSQTFNFHTMVDSLGRSYWQYDD